MSDLRTRGTLPCSHVPGISPVGFADFALVMASLSRCCFGFQASPDWLEEQSKPMFFLVTHSDSNEGDLVVRKVLYVFTRVSELPHELRWSNAAHTQ